MKFLEQLPYGYRTAATEVSGWRRGGASRYHPVMMTKVFVYGYMTKVCSSRMLAKAVRENITPCRNRGRLILPRSLTVFKTAWEQWERR
ncbi:MAG: transposase [Treponema sp.]|nr:transposase [Treponema sp.]